VSAALAPFLPANTQQLLPIGRRNIRKKKAPTAVATSA